MTDAEKVSLVCAQVIEGQSLNKAIKEVFGDARRFDAALKADPTLRQQKDEALLLRSDLMALEIVEIADTEEDANKARNRIQARQWVAARMNPKSWGDRLEVLSHQNISINDALAGARARCASVTELVQDAEIIQPSNLGTSGPTEPDIFT